jgi:hypothetical protein
VFLTLVEQIKSILLEDLADTICIEEMLRMIMIQDNELSKEDLVFEETKEKQKG